MKRINGGSFRKGDPRTRKAGSKGGLNSQANRRAERERIEKQRGVHEPDRTPLDPWLNENFPTAVSKPMGEHHGRLWDWFEAKKLGEKLRALVECWARGGGKTTGWELGVVRLGMKQTASFALIVSATQTLVNKKIQAIRTRFETLGMPRAVSEYHGGSLGWSMTLLRLENGFNVLGLGLDAAGRGVKLDDVRPDLIVFDDIDERHDSPATVKKKIETITQSILPTGSADAAVLVVQNRIHEDSIVSQLLDGRADFLLGCEAHEVPAVLDLEYESVIGTDGLRRYRITGGEATWDGQDLATCEAQFNEWGRAAFLREAQHETKDPEDGLWQRARDIDPFRVGADSLPRFGRVAVAVDPNTSSKGDEAGIVAAAIANVDNVVHGFVLEDATIAGGPSAWAQAAVACFHRWGADVLVAESNQGGEMIAATIGTVPGAPAVKLIHASKGKLTRAEPVQKLYEDGRVHHVGVFAHLERELCGWRPGDPSPNRLDAAVWVLTELMLSGADYSGISISNEGLVQEGWHRAFQSSPVGYDGGDPRDYDDVFSVGEWRL